MILVVDGIAFQLGRGAVARLWYALLRDLQFKKNLKIIALDRGNFPKLENAVVVPFPSYTHTMTANDSMLIQKICDLHKADLFVSTYYTSALTTPSVLSVYDMSAEIFQSDTNSRIWKEKTVAMTCAQRYVCMSKSTKDDLLRFHPSIDHTKIASSYYRPDSAAFYHDSNEDQYFSSNYSGKRNYVLINEMMTDQVRPNHRKELLGMLSHVVDLGFDVICCNSYSYQISGALNLYGADTKIQFVDYSSKELGDYYRNAFAFLCHAPSEDYAISVIEAMACGCPVISLGSGYVSEICEKAAYYLSDLGRETIESAIHQLNDDKARSSMRHLGLIQSRKFRNSNLSDVLMASLSAGLIDSQSESSVAFRNIFASLRVIQSEVDTDVFVE